MKNKLTHRLVLIGAWLALSLGCSDAQESFEKFDEAETGKKKVAICISEFLTVRADAYVLAPKVAFLAKGEQVEVLNISRRKDRVGGKKGYWYKIKKADGIIGWSHGNYLKQLEIESEEDLATHTEDLLAQEASRVRVMLYGKYFSVDNQGLYTKHKLYFFKDGIYAYGWVGAKLKDGTYAVNPADKVIELSKSSTIGKKVSYVLAGSSLTLYGKRGSKTVRLIKAEGNPFADEIGGDKILPDAVKKLKEKQPKKDS